MRTKRFLSIALTLVMLLGMLPGMSLTAYADGNTTTITPTNTSGTMTITLTIAPATVDVTGLTLKKGDTEINGAQEIEVGESFALTAVISPEEATDKTVKWRTTGGVTLYSDDNCTADNEIGEDATSTLTVYAKGVSAGSATVTVTSNADASKTASCDVTVNAANPTVPTDGETKQVTFNGKQWYVIKDESETAGTLTLLYAGSLGNAPFDTNGSNVYANSSIKAALGSMTAEGGYYYPVAEAIKDTDNGKLYLLSEDEAKQVPQNVRADFNGDAWWLRDERPDGKVAYVFVKDTVQNKPGRIPESGASPTLSVGVRPALQLDLSKVVYDETNKAFYIPVTAPTGITVTGATLAAGYGAGSVSVTATAAAGHTLSYQWYQSATNSNKDGTLIEGATSATYTIPTGNAVGEYYYYCVVTATRTDNNQTASVTSDVAVVTVAADTDALVAKLAEKNNIDLSQYYLIPAADMYFTANEYWNINSSWEKLPDEAGKKHVATKQFTMQGLPKDSLIFCKAYYAFEAVAWGSAGNSETIGKRYSLLTKISDQFAWWDNYSLFGFNLTKYAEGDFNTIEAADVSSISDAFRIYVPKSADAAEVNGTSYPTVADAIRAAGAGGTVKLLRDVTENVVLTSGKNITLNLNGHKLTNDGRHCTILAQNGSTLVVTGNGTVDNTTHGCAPLYNNGGTVTLNSGTFIRSLEDGEDGGNTYYTVVNRGTMTINEGVTVTNGDYHYSSLIINGYNGLNKTGYREIDPKVSNGYVAGESAEKPTLTINGGTFTGGNQALKNDVKGVATINGGSFSSSGGHAIKNLSELTISGGTFTAEAEGKFALYSAESGTATVTGGTFEGKLQKDEGASITINGKEFSNNLHSADEVKGMLGSTAPTNNDLATQENDTLFLGWYKDEACTQPITSEADIPEGGAYAKFIPANSLGLGVQFRVPAKSGQADKTDLRLVATVPDPSLYSAIGFKVEAYRNNTWKPLTDSAFTENIYSDYVWQTNPDGTLSPYTVEIAHSQHIGNVDWSKYITCCALLNMPNSYYTNDAQTQFKVTQYIITADGARSEIGAKTFTIAQGADGYPCVVH